MKRIVTTGAESTGKTTLARALAEALGAPLSEEHVRDYVAALDRPLEQADLEPIARGQIEYEDAAAADAPAIVVHDTNLLSSIIYARYYFQTALQWVDEAFENRSYDLYVLCGTDIPWQPEPGQRESVEARDRLQGKFREELKRRSLPFIEVWGSVDERCEAAVAAIKKLDRS